MRELEKRIQKDRREDSTRCLSRHTFSGQRRMLRREIDQKKGSYVDRYDLKLFLLLILIAVLNTFDSVFTKTILDRGGLELNPIVHVAYELWGDRIWTWKIVAMPCLLFFYTFTANSRGSKSVLWVSVTFIPPWHFTKPSNIC